MCGDICAGTEFLWRGRGSCLYRSVDIFVPPVRRVFRGISVYSRLFVRIFLESVPFNLKNIGGIELNDYSTTTNRLAIL